MYQDTGRKRTNVQNTYSSVFESMMYVMMCTRPDICYVVGLASRFQSNIDIKHWMTVWTLPDPQADATHLKKKKEKVFEL